MTCQQIGQPRRNKLLGTYNRQIQPTKTDLRNRKKKQQNPPHVTPVKSLYFVGQQSENAGGVGAVMLGAKAAYEKASKTFK